MGSSLIDAVGTTLSAGHEALDDGAAGAESLGNVELLGIHAVVVLGGGSVLASDQVENDLYLSGSDANISQVSFCFHLKILLSAYLPLLDVLEPAWPL